MLGGSARGTQARSPAFSAGPISALALGPISTLALGAISRYALGPIISLISAAALA
jgi:hypothetical protein